MTKVSLLSRGLEIRNHLSFFYAGLASTYPEPQDKRKWLEEQLYNFNYESSLPVTWVWPRMPYIKTRDLNPTKLFGDSSD